jgi:protein tyrosine phosphatase
LYNFISAYVPYVSFEPFSSETTDLDALNGKFVGTFECPDKFLVVKQPSSQTLGHFWALVEKQNVMVILSLDKIISDVSDPLLQKLRLQP